MNHPVLGEIEVVQSLRARRIAITVRPSGDVRVSFPRRVSQREALTFLETKIDWILRVRKRLAAQQANRPTPLTPEQLRTKIEALRQAAKADLPTRIERLSAETGLKYNGMTIRASRTRWGSCSGRNTISLSLFLMTLPEHLRDYVIVHELCHTIHHNHSAQFHALVDRLLGGNEKVLRQELKKYAIRR